MHTGPRQAASRRVAGPGALALLALLACGCGSPTTFPIAPETPVIRPIPLATAWPHEDGRSSGYRYINRLGPTGSQNLFPTAAAVPAVTLDEVAALLENQPPFTPVYETTVGYLLTFDGQDTTAFGVEAQSFAMAYTSYPLPAPLLRKSRSRPALAGVDPDPPLLLAGGAWLQEPSRIARYGDDTPAPEWVWLAGTLADRRPWQTTLYPGTGNEAVLSARAYQSVIADVAGLHLEDALDVHYLLDHGIETLSLGGGAVAYRRRFSYGRVIWGSGLGPLYLYERRNLEAGSPPTLGTVESTLLYERTTVPGAFVDGRWASR